MKALVRAVAANPIARSVIALLVCLASLGGLALTAYADQFINSGVAWGPEIPYVENADVSPLGINLFLEKEVDPEKVARTLDMVRDGGFAWVRQTFAWNDIEIHGKGDFIDKRNPEAWVDAWAKYDRIVEETTKRGLRIIARLDAPPNWARIPGDDVQTYHKGPPANNADYADFVRAVATRYRGKVRHFQIWNEPNLQGEWGGHPVSPEEYTALLKAAYEAIKEVDPEAVVITAALAPTAEKSIANLNDVLFLEGMYEAGAAPYFDVLSTMLYGLGQSPNERRTDLNRLNFSRPILLRHVMEQNGDTQKPIWISEYAWISLPPDFEGDPGKNIWGESVDEETQARWLVEGYERSQTEWPWMGVMSVWHFRQPDPLPGEPANYFAIVRDDFTPRPAYDALKEYSRRFPMADVGKYRWQSPLVSSTGAAHEAGDQPDIYTTTFRFAGTRLDIDVSEEPVSLDVSVDGGAARRVDTGVGQTTLAGSLPFAPHTTTIALERRIEPRLQGITVSREKPLWNALGFPLAYGLFGLLAVACGGSVLAGLGRGAQAALDRPRGRYSEAARETARNAAAATGMALLVGLYYWANSPPLVLGALAALGLLVLLKPSMGLAAVVFSIPFFWYPKFIGEQKFPLSETLILLVFGAVTARRLVGFLLPGLARRLNFTAAETRPTVTVTKSKTQDGKRSPRHLQTTVLPTRTSDDLYDLLPARWPPRPTTVPLTSPPTTLLESKVESPRSKVQSVEPATEQVAPSLTEAHVEAKSKIQTLKSKILEWGREDAFALQAVALLVLGGLSLLWLADPTYAKDSARAYRWVIVEPVLFYFLITDVIAGKRALWRMADFFVAAAVVISIVGIWQFASESRVLDVQGVSRVFGTYQHPNNLALYLGRVLPFAACAGLFLPAGWRKALYLAACLPLALTTFLTFSRGAYLAVGLAVAVGVLLGLTLRPGRSAGREPGRDRRLLYASGAALALGLALVITAAVLPSVWARVTDLGSGTLRVKLWESSFRMLADHPVTGVGPDQFLNQFREHYSTEEQQGEAWTSHPHNLVLDYWLTLGIMGVPLLLWLLWRYFREALGKVRRAVEGGASDLAGRALTLGLIASMVDFVVHGLVDNSYFLMDLALIFWLSCGLLQVERVKRET